jgi:hypothetical protein
MEANIKSQWISQVIPTNLAEGAGKEQVESYFLTMSRAQHNYNHCLEAFFLLRMFLTLSISISNSQANTLNLVAQLESHIHIKGFGG